MNQMEMKMNRVQQNDGEPGLKCPRCGTFIPTTIVQLLTSHNLRCSRCLLELKMDRQASDEALDVLRKVQEAKEKVEKVSKFNR